MPTLEDISVVGACPYCSGIFGRDAVEIPSAFNTVLWQTPEAVITPTLGMLLPGYLLSIPRSHVDSLGCLEPADQETILQFTRSAIECLAAEFGPYLIFERGSDPTTAHTDSVTHAHLHLVPSADKVVPALLRLLPWELIPPSSDLRSLALKDYVYLESNGVRWVVADPSVPRQMIRRVVAQVAGRPESWDWRRSPGKSTLRATLVRLGRLRADVIDPAHGDRTSAAAADKDSR
jgi:diadenosine tetraphosphate (Ap4A) HIT family hydrolase